MVVFQGLAVAVVLYLSYLAFEKVTRRVMCPLCKRMVRRLFQPVGAKIHMCKKCSDEIFDAHIRSLDKENGHV